MPYCNGADRGCACEAGWGNEKGFLLSLRLVGNITLLPKQADFPLVWRHERIWPTDFRGRRRYVGSGNASWCGPQSWQHELSAPGAYRGGFFRQAKAGRIWAIRPRRGTILLHGGSSTSPRPNRE